MTTKEEELTLELPHQEPNHDEDMTTESSTDGPSSPEGAPKKRKRVRMCDVCAERPATQIKKLRKHAWTDKNRESFARCQEAKRLKQLYEKTKKSYGDILAESEKYTFEEKDKAAAEFKKAKEELESYNKQLAEARTKKQADEHVTPVDEKSGQPEH